ncbi:MAG: class I SAM-dependent methyltransferase [Candidatus Competibacterales bacterium]
MVIVVEALPADAGDTLVGTLGATRWQAPAPPPFPHLALTPERLEWRDPTGGDGPVHVDFVKGPLAYRRRHGGGRQQPLARAVGLKGGWGRGGAGESPRILDATAGLGRDAFVLASLGCRVTMLERSAVVHALLADALVRGAADPELGSWLPQRLHLERVDARAWLRAAPTDQGAFDVVYLDPMYPERRKAARVKKTAATLQRLVGFDADAADLLAIALTVARRRVVVKRPRWAPPLAGPPPVGTTGAVNTRFDIYAPTSPPPAP